LILALYLGCLVVGGVLIAVSLAGGGHDDASDTGDHGGDLGHDHDHDHEHGHHGGDGVFKGMSNADSAATLLTSTRFWTFALASFGMTGLLIRLGGVTDLLGLPVSGVLGIGIGLVAAKVMRSVARERVTGTVSTASTRGQEAEVMLAIGPGKTGKVRLEVAGATLELMATTREDRVIERKERVIIVDVKGGVADVTPATPAPKAIPQSTPES